MTVIGILVLVILVILMVWIIGQMGLQEPFRTIFMVVLLLIVLVGVLYTLGIVPHGRIVIQ